MRVYIPFNSNDFNSVFTTLSISPRAYYINRNYSFKRSTSSFFIESEEFLVGFEKPIFHNKTFEEDFGFPILIETELENIESTWEADQSGWNYLIIHDSVLLMNQFKLHFRSQKELDETFARALKSIETKYTVLAKQNSEVSNDYFFVEEPPRINFPIKNINLNSTTFFYERTFNRLLGAILGSSISSLNTVPKQWIEITMLLRSLNNCLSLFLNKLSEDNRYEKRRAVEIIDSIKQVYESIEKIDEVLMLQGNIFLTSDLLCSLKEASAFNIPLYNFLIEGLLVTPKIKLPLALKLEKLKRNINASINLKFPNKYIERVNNSFWEIRNDIDDKIESAKKENKLTKESFVSPSFTNGKLELILPGGLAENERRYFLHTLLFFIKKDNIYDVDTFFSKRKEILKELATYFKSVFEDFDKSEEREYLIDLHKSFDSLRGGFNISGTSNEVLKVIAILFSSGRDLSRFIENNEREEIQNSLFYYSLWGSIYGAASLPKTLTQMVTGDNKNVQILINSYSETLLDFEKNKGKCFVLIEDNLRQLSNSGSNQIVSKSLSSETKTNNLNEPKERYELDFSDLGKKMIEILKLKKEVMLKDLLFLSRDFKTNGDVESFIDKDLKGFLRVVKKGRVKYAEIID